jgi:hypothetical protein
MKVYQEITPVTGSDIFVILDSINKGFEYPIHNHPEFELTLVTGSAGTDCRRLCLHYKEDDLVLIGPYLFHKWDDEEVKALRTSCRVITFNLTCICLTSILSKKPFALIQTLLSSSGVVSSLQEKH